MRLLGIDYGDSRIGLAASDLLNLTAQPLKVIHVKKGWKNAVPVIRDIIRELEIDKVVIGYPIKLDGTIGDRCEVTDRFIDVLAKDINDIELIKWDERYTTKEAIELIGKGDKREGRHDIVSAVLILQSYLDFYSKQI